MLASLGSFLHARGRVVLAVAVLGGAIAGAFGIGVAKSLWPYDARDPGTQSVQAAKRFESASGHQIDPGVIALVRSGNARTARARRRVAQVVAELRSQPHIALVRSFYTTHDPAMISLRGDATYVVAYFQPLSNKALKDVAQQIEGRFAGQHDVVLGGSAVANAQVNNEVSKDLARAEVLAFPFIFLLSLLFFRSLVAALLPPLLGGLAIVVTFLVLRVVASFVDISVYALNFTTGMGLGLAIDYSLFMVSRYREEAARTGFGPEALIRTLQTAGRTILFSSSTIAVAVASLIVFPQNFLRSMGIAGAIVSVLAATLALSALPALLAVLGPRINALAPRRLQHAAEREARPAEQGAWYRLSRVVMRRPTPIAACSAALLIAMGIPFWGIRLITADRRVLPQSSSARQVGDALSTEFPPNRTTPLEVVVGAPARSSEVRRLAARMAALPGVAAVAPAQPAGRYSLVQVAPTHGPLTGVTEQLVAQVRSIREPFYVGVGGQTALFVDLEHSLTVHLAPVLGIVIGSTLIILFLMTGSLILPLKAVLMNFLSLSAMFGLLVLIFQDGHLQSVLGFTSEGALDATQPIFLFAVGFGLATDYGVFLLSRIKEARDAGAADSEAVAIGLERTGRIVTAAALLFAVAIGAFVTSHVVFIKELGLGAALAVLIDASLIRALLVPSLMELLGSVNWWAPRPLRRLHARIGLREAAPPPVLSSG